MAIYEKAEKDQTNRLPEQVRQELNKGVASAIVSRTVVDGEEYARLHVMSTEIFVPEEDD